MHCNSHSFSPKARTKWAGEIVQLMYNSMIQPLKAKSGAYVRPWVWFTVPHRKENTEDPVFPLTVGCEWTEARLGFLCLPVNPGGTWYRVFQHGVILHPICTMSHRPTFLAVWLSILHVEEAVSKGFLAGCADEAGRMPCLSQSMHHFLEERLWVQDRKFPRRKGARLGFCTRSGCCPSSLRNGAEGLHKADAGEGRGGWRREVLLIRATLPKGHWESGPQADERWGQAVKQELAFQNPSTIRSWWHMCISLLA